MVTATRKPTSLSTTEFAALGLLSFGERSGYEMKKAAEASVGYVWSPAKSHLYAVLPRLVAGRFATSRHVVQQRRPDKQVYRITKKGERALQAWLEEPADGNSFLLKIFFGTLMSKKALVAHIERKRAQTVRELEEYREIERGIRDDERSYYGYVTLRYGLSQSRALIRWADEILRELEDRP